MKEGELVKIQIIFFIKLYFVCDTEENKMNLMLK